MGSTTHRLSKEAEAGFLKFAAWVERTDKLMGKSSMWKSLIKDFDVSWSSNDDRDMLFRPGHFRAYNFFYAKYETTGSAVRRIVLEITFWLAKVLNYARDRIWECNVNAFGAGQAAFHPSGERFLKGAGLYKGYLEFCDHFKFSPYTASGIKSYYVASRMLPYLKGKSNPRVVEIGAGMGNLAIVMNFAHPAFQYVILDLPEMLTSSSLTLQACFPEVPCYFVFPGSQDVYESNRPGFYFCVPDCAEQLTSHVFDLACNVDSFQEMTQTQVATYLQLIQRIVREEGHFLNMNRRKFLQDEAFDNNPLLYPYGKTNRVLIWENDAFMERVFNYNRVRLDGWLFRAEQIRN